MTRTSGHTPQGPEKKGTTEGNQLQQNLNDQAPAREQPSALALPSDLPVEPAPVSEWNFAMSRFKSVVLRKVSIFYGSLGFALAVSVAVHSSVGLPMDTIHSLTSDLLGASKLTTLLLGFAITAILLSKGFPKQIWLKELASDLHGGMEQAFGIAIPFFAAFCLTSLAIVYLLGEGMGLMGWIHIAYIWAALLAAFFGPTLLNRLHFKKDDDEIVFKILGPIVLLASIAIVFNSTN